MNELNTMKELFTYESDELFYKEYDEAKKKDRIQQFLNSYSADEIRKRKLIVREIKNGWNPVAMDDEMLFSNDADDDIIVQNISVTHLYLCTSTHFLR